MEIRFEGATFRYRPRERAVLEDFDLTIPPGRTILLGPNGAGKSTLLGVAASVLRLGRGRVTVGELSPDGRRNRVEFRRRVAWMPQTIRATSGLSVREQVALHGWLAGLDRTRAWDGAEAALGRVDLADQSSRPAAKLSGGQRARMGLAQALVHGADVLLFDEPTAALDPDQKQAFASLLTEVSENRTVVVSTHDVSDLEESYDHVVVIDSGRVRFLGTTDEFLASGGAGRSAVEAYRAAVGSR